VPPQLIDLTGLSLTDVEMVITAFNEESGLALEFTIENVPTDQPEAVGRVLNTNPPPGALVEPGQLITIFVGVPDLGGGDG